MGLYTAIRFTPIDRAWLASPEFIIGVASILGATTFDHFTVLHEISDDPSLDDDERYEEIMRRQDVSLGEALPLRRAGNGYWTHMMFRYGEFMKQLTAEVLAELPQSLYLDFSPWDTSIDDGHWAIYSYEDGTLTDGGAFSFNMSANGCPSDRKLYLERFLAVETVKRFQRQLEALSNQSWTAVIDLT